jgi:hypothetical protein
MGVGGGGERVGRAAKITIALYTQHKEKHTGHRGEGKGLDFNK